MIPPLDPIPQYHPVIQDDPQHPSPMKQYLGAVWYRWLASVITRLLQGVLTRKSYSASNQSAAIAGTTIFSPDQVGLYQVVWFLKITIADGVSSSATVTISWKTGGNVCSKTFPAITGDSLTTSDSGIAILKPDTGQAIQIAVAYASNTPNKMRYDVVADVHQSS